MEAFFLYEFKNLKKRVDYIIVGQGIAGTVLAAEMLRRNKSVKVVDEFNNNSSSRIALGIYNPLVLKWFTKSWKSEILLKNLYSFYKYFEEKFSVKIIHKKNIYKYLESNYIINTWLEKQSSPNRRKYMSGKFKYIDSVEQPFGVVFNSGWVDTKLMLNTFRRFLKEKNLIEEKVFSHDRLIIKNDFIEYNNYEARSIIFCEGSAVKKNPFFNDLNFKMTKGEVIYFRSSDLCVKNIVHSGVITLPIENNTYYSGATFDWNTECLIPTEDAKNKILKKVHKVKQFKYELIDQKVAVRPSVIDRRPIIGSHQQYKNLYIMNGLGSRGVLLSPYLANQLCSNIIEKGVIDKEISINRFNKN